MVLNITNQILKEHDEWTGQLIKLLPNPIKLQDMWYFKVENNIIITLHFPSNLLVSHYSLGQVPK